MNLPERATVAIEGRIVHLRAWRYELKGVTGGLVPVYVLDTPGEHRLGSDID